MRVAQQREKSGLLKMAVSGEGVNGGVQHGGLPGPGGALDEDEPVPAGDGAGGVGLGDVQPDDLDPARRCRVVGLAVHSPRQDVLLLGEDLLARVLGSGRLDPHRTPIGVPGPFPTTVRVPGTQRGLVQAAEHALAAFQVAGIQRQPAPIRDLDLRRDHRMRVQLRIIGTRRRLPERGHRQPVRRREHPRPVHTNPRRRPEPLHMRQRRRDRLIMHCEDPLVPREGPQHTHGLRRRERRIEPGHRPHHTPVRAEAI